jgi:oligopeptidase B
MNKFFEFPYFTNLDNYYTQKVSIDDVHYGFNYYQASHFSLPKDKNIVINTKNIKPNAKYVKLGELEFSRLNKYFVFGVDFSGAEKFRLFYGESDNWKLKEIKDANISDNYCFIEDTLFYTQFDSTFRNFRVKDWNGKVIFQENNKEMTVYIYPDIEARGLLIQVSSYNETEFLHYFNGKLKIVFHRRMSEIGFLDYSHEYNTFYLSIANKGFAEIPDTEVLNIPNFNRYQVFRGIVEDFLSKGRDTIILSRSKDTGIQKLWRYRGLKLNEIKTVKQISNYQLSGKFKQERRNRDIAYIYFSNTSTPEKILEYSFNENTFIREIENPIFKEPKNISGITKLINDIPVTMITNKKKTDKVYLMVYGSYGTVYCPTYDELLQEIIKLGFDICVAHVRGGGEKGISWYLDGKLLKKKNSFFDTLNIVNHLKERYKKVIIFGRSAGGLTAGATLNLQPSLFTAAILQVPFVNPLATMSNPTIPLTVAEYSEIGNPAIPRYYKYISEYDPVENVNPHLEYPPILLIGGKKDQRVLLKEPKEYYKKMKKINNKVKLVIQDYGHFGPTNQKEKEEERKIFVDFLKRL